MITRFGSSFWAGAGQRLGRSLEVPGLGRAGQMPDAGGFGLEVLGRSGQTLAICI